jgi:Uma2 family endonuclease
VSVNRIFNESNWVVDLASFRRWTDSADFPEEGRFDWVLGRVCVDTCDEQVFTHSSVKTEYTVVLGTLARDEKRGHYWVDGPRLSNEEADLSVRPDGLFVSMKSLKSKRLRLVEGVEGGIVELEGSPDMVLEIVSASSVQKDMEFLRDAYWRAGVLEYWLVDARRLPLTFEILHHTARGYATTRKQEGWVRSRVFGRSFQLTQLTGVLGHPEYRLLVDKR